MNHPPAFNHPAAFEHHAEVERPVVHPVFVHEEHRPFIEPVVFHEPPIHPVVVDEPIVAAPVVIQPVVFPDVKPQELDKILAKLAGEGYKIEPASAASGSLEHGGFFGHFSATYSVSEAGLEVTTASHQDKIREDVQKALIFARG